MITLNEFPVISTKEQLAELVDRIGFLPFFSSGIPGFSLRDHVDPSVWFVDDVEGPWEWKGEVGVYGKLFRGKAVFMSPEWYAILACFRRDGYDYEGMYEDGFLPHDALPIMAELEKESVISTDLRARVRLNFKDSGFDKVMNLLQMKCFVLPTSFEYSFDTKGRRYGWGLARYTLSDKRFGALIEDAEAKYKPTEAKELLIERMMAICPGIDRKKAERFVK
ncbi:MAG: hypothetical protein IJL59_03535 [Clostridia bacterium]|nr:hypothetical protein [Clostridia bacterium]MBQ7061375.1 hypothetical protein [Clostridia bacterium]